MDKSVVVARIIETLTADLDTQVAAAQDSYENATSDETKSEGKYDTRALESSYLAEGQGRIVNELQEALETYRALQPRAFAPGEPIALTALVELQQGSACDLYFLGPRSGGIEVQAEGREIFVVTPQSPLGRELLGKIAGANVRIDHGSEAKIAGVE